MSGTTHPAVASLPSTEDVLPQSSRMRAERQRTRDLATARSALFASEAVFRRALLLADEMTPSQRRVLAARRAELEQMRRAVAALEAERND